jgi:4-amino-4-deoxy-L-arabinose transferase-like glycosyltransferase
VTATLDSGVHGRQSAGTRRQSIAGWEVIAVVGAMAVVGVIGVIAISRGAPLLWDEAVYSLRVRELVGEVVRGHYWIEVRAPGLPVLLSAAWLLPGGGDLLSVGDAVVLRAMCLVLAVAGIGLTWVIARSLIGAHGAAVAAWLLAIAPGWHESSWQVMPDITGTVLTLAAMAVILFAARGARVTWWALLAAPLCGAATLVRYGAPLLVGPTVLAALLLRREAVQSSRLRSLVVLASTAVAAGVVWFVPAVTGSSRPPVLIFAGRQDEKAVPALASAADFLTTLFELVGPLFGPLVVIGGGVALVAAVRQRELRVPAVACALIALSVLLLMLFGIAEYNVRYLTPSLPFLAILAAVGLVRVAERPMSAGLVALVAAVGVAGVGIAAGTAVDRTNEMTQTFDPVRAAYEGITATAEAPCVVLDYNPTAEWYTGCAVFGASNPPYLAADTFPRAGIDPDEPLFAVIRSWPNRANPSAQAKVLLQELAVGALDTPPSVTVLDLGSVGRFTAALEQRGMLAPR